jgi:hypothetical protein
VGRDTRVVIDCVCEGRVFGVEGSAETGRWLGSAGPERGKIERWLVFVLCAIVDGGPAPVDDCDAVLECDFKENAADGSRRTLILLPGLFEVAEPFDLAKSDSFSASSVSPDATPANQPSPSSYGFARGDPLTLSMFSSRLGSRIVGNAVDLGKTGAKVFVDGGWYRLGSGVVPTGLVGECGRLGKVGYLDCLCGLGDGADGIRPIVRDYQNTRKNT